MSVQPQSLHQSNSSHRRSPAPLSLTLNGIHKSFDKTVALNGIDLQIHKGEFFSLLGPSGCGKTTLLRIVAGLELADEGTIRIGDREVSQLPAHQRPVNTVFQNYALFAHMSVEQNVAFGLQMRRVPRRQRREKVQQAMDLVNIVPLACRKPRQLSGGQQQRVALARAIVNEPEVLLLDEPLSALDAQLRKQLQGQLGQLQRRLGITFIFVTHDQEQALTMSDRIAVMRDGCIEQMGSVRDIYERPATPFVASFFGASNTIAGEICGPDCVQTAIGKLTVSSELLSEAIAATPSPPIQLSIRPEKIRLSPHRDDSANPIAVRVINLTYSGSQTQYLLHTHNDIPLNVTCFNDRSEQGFAIGDRLYAHLPPNSLIPIHSPPPSTPSGSGEDPR